MTTEGMNEGQYLLTSIKNCDNLFPTARKQVGGSRPMTDAELFYVVTLFIMATKIFDVKQVTLIVGSAVLTLTYGRRLIGQLEKKYPRDDNVRPNKTEMRKALNSLRGSILANPARESGPQFLDE